MTKHLVAGAFMVVALGLTTFAQAPQPPKPSAEQKELAYFVGRWTSEGEMKPGPFGPGGKATGSDTCEWFEGGFSVVCRGQAKSPMGTMSSLGVMSYSAADKAYTYYAIDSMGMSELARGNKKGNTWVYTATSNFGGQSFQSRYTIVVTGPGSYTFTWESSPDGTKWSTMFEGKATRAGGTSR